MAGVSPIPAELVARSAVSFDALQSVGDTLYWIEGRPDGDVLVAWSPAEGRRDVLGEGFSVASHVHEYGGGAYLADERSIWFCNADDQRIYRSTRGSVPEPVTPVPPDAQSLRYADLRLMPGLGKLVCVRERHEARSAHNELVVLPVDGSAEPSVIASGDDFSMSPSPSPDGTRLAWVSWSSPLMPWDGSWLWLADVRPDGTLVNTRLVAGGAEESICQPQWSAEGDLYFVSDRSGWWNLYVWQHEAASPVITGDFELAAAPWEFGYRTYALNEGRITAIVQEGSEHYLATWCEGEGLKRVALPYTSLKPYLAMAGADTMLIASSPERLPAVVTVDADGSIRELASAEPAEGWGHVALPERFTFATRDGSEAHGLYYAPESRSNRLPPLIVRAHPGPTSNWPLRLDPHAQFFTSRGFAVADIDYRGSTGYGRAFRLGLRHRWGTVDAQDCADAAMHLAGIRYADPRRMAIWGASAGGYTVLQALALTDAFVGGIARSAIVDPRSWAQAAPAFQARHAELLVGDETDALHLTEARRPVLLIHGDKDPVTPPEHVRTLAEQLKEDAHLILIPGGGHTFRGPEDLQRILAAELAHLRSLFVI